MSTARKLEEELTHLLEELRITLPGIQIVFAFLLMVPFNQRFERVDPLGLVLFGSALACACVASLLLIAPTVYHRLHFRREIMDKRSMLELFNVLALTGSAFLAAAIVCSLAFLAEFLFGPRGAVLAAALSGTFCLALWYGLPLWRRGRERWYRHQALESLALRSERRGDRLE